MSTTCLVALDPPLLPRRVGLSASRADGAPRPPFCPPAGSLPVLLNKEWEQLRQGPGTAAALRRWVAAASWIRTTAHDELARLDDLDGLVRYVQDASRTVPERDEVLLYLLALCQEGDRLAGRVVLQVMLPKAIRLALSLSRHPDWTDGPDEARATVLAALWIEIASYPVERRAGRVTANLALDTLARVQRGHTGSSRRVHRVRELPCADIALLADPAHVDVGADDPAGPADAELCTLLAWGVRTGVLQSQEAQLLVRVYGLGAQDGPVTTEAVAAEMGLKASALRQRCHRLARRLGQAALESGLTEAAPSVASLLPAA